MREQAKVNNRAKETYTCDGCKVSYEDEPCLEFLLTDEAKTKGNFSHGRYTVCYRCWLRGMGVKLD